METTVLHGQLSQVDESGNVLILHPENDGTDVKVDRTANTVGASGASAIPSDVNNLQKLINKMGALAFKTNIGTGDFSSSVVTTDLTVTTSGKILDARAGKTLNDKITNLQNEDKKLSESITQLNSNLDGKANSGHTHDDR